MSQIRFIFTLAAWILLCFGCAGETENYVFPEDHQNTHGNQNPPSGEQPGNDNQPKEPPVICDYTSCVDGKRVCTLEGDVMICGDFNGDGCTEWSNIPCDRLAGCENGFCADDQSSGNTEEGECQDSCAPENSYTCGTTADGKSGIRLCTDLNGDGCLEWSSVTACPEGQVCSGGKCACTDQCTSGATECGGANGASLRTCEDTNLDGCFEWSAFQVCDGKCVEGACQCEHQCAPEASVCAENGYQLCMTNAHGCRKWSAVIPCENGCANGQCKSAAVMKPTRYPGDTILSPVTAYSVEKMKAIAANQTRDATHFMKVGDSHMYSGSVFMYCFSKTGAKGGMNLNGETSLQDVIDTFQSSGFDSFHRDSVAAVLGKTAYWAVSGGYITQEMNASNPRFAFYGYGTNDMGWFGYTKPESGSGGYFNTLEWYYQNVLKGAKTMMSAGVIPLFIGTGYRTDKPSVANAGLLPIHWVKTFDAVARGIAEAYQVPYYNLALSQMPLSSSGYGLGGDGIHHKAVGKGCDFTSNGLTGGANIRNHYAIQMLDRAWRALIKGEEAPDPVIEFEGDGSADAPWIISSLPYTHSANTANGHRRFTTYNCSTTSEEGPEFYYRLTLDSPKKIRAFALSSTGSVDVDIHLLRALDASQCMARGNRWVEASLSQGTYYFVVDTYTTTSAGEYLFGIVVCDDDDAYCAQKTTGG